MAKMHNVAFLGKPIYLIYVKSLAVAVCTYVLIFLGFRLNSSILMTKIVSQRIDCIMECAIEPCCRSVNYKKSSNYENETNCEMLHDLSDTHDTSTELMKQSSAYDHVYLLIPHKVNNTICNLCNTVRYTFRYSVVICRYCQRINLSRNFHFLIVQWNRANISSHCTVIAFCRKS